MKKTIGLLALCAFSLLGASDPFIGTWRLDLAKSTFSPGPAPQSQTVVIGADNRVEVSGTDAKGQSQSWSYTFAQGASTTITGMSDASVTEKRKGNTVEHVWKIGKGTEKGHGVVSKDGKTMTYTLTGTDADGKKVHDKEVYEKQ